MILIDTSYLIALMNSNDQLHHRARAWGETVTERLLVTEHVLWEMVNGFSMPSDRPKAHAAIDWVQGNSGCVVVPATTELFETGLQLHREREDKEWSLTDCISFVVMQQNDLQRALTYDHHFEQAGFEALLRHDPP